MDDNQQCFVYLGEAPNVKYLFRSLTGPDFASDDDITLECVRVYNAVIDYGGLRQGENMVIYNLFPDRNLPVQVYHEKRGKLNMTQDFIAEAFQKLLEADRSAITSVMLIKSPVADPDNPEDKGYYNIYPVNEPYVHSIISLIKAMGESETKLECSPVRVAASTKEH